MSSAVRFFAPIITWGSFWGQRGKKRGSFRGRFGDHFAVVYHFGIGIISGAVQVSDYKVSNPDPILEHHVQFSFGTDIYKIDRMYLH